MFLYPNNNNYFANSFHIGCFQASGSTSAIYSRKGSDISGSAMPINQGYYAANARGTNYDCFSFQQWTYLQALFVLLFKSTRSQTSHSYGYWYKYNFDAPNLKNVGNQTNQFGMSGRTSSSSSYSKSMSFFWIHNLWGNVFIPIGGMFLSRDLSIGGYRYHYWLPRMANSRAWYPSRTWNSASYPAATQYNIGTSTKTIYRVVGRFKEACGTNILGFIPYKIGGSNTTYYSDECAVNDPTSDDDEYEYANFILASNNNTNSSTTVPNNGIFSFRVVGTTSVESRIPRLTYRGGH